MYSTYLNEVAERFTSIMKKSPECTLYRDPENTKGSSYKSKYYSCSQVFKYEGKNSDYLFVRTIPYSWSPEPIFLFQLKQNKYGTSEGYIDVVPVLKNYNISYKSSWNKKQTSPEWMSLLSLQYLHVDLNTQEELNSFVDMSISTYSTYLLSTLENTARDNSKDIEEIHSFYKSVYSNIINTTA